MILFLAARHPYNNPLRGESYEYVVLLQTLRHAFSDVVFLDPYTDPEISVKISKLADTVERVVYVPYLGSAVEILETSHLKSANVFVFCMDDSWRIGLVEKVFSAGFRLISPDPHYGFRYRDVISRVRFMPFGFSREMVSDRKWRARDIEISFIGARDSYREYLIEKVRAENFDVRVYGPGWDLGSLDQKSFCDVMSRSKVVLNLSNSRQYDLRYLLSKPTGFFKGLRSGKKIEQIKARHQEIPASGACQLSYYTPGLERVYAIGDEILCYSSVEELLMWLRVLQEQPSVASSVARRGSVRCLEDYAYESQWRKVLDD